MVKGQGLDSLLSYMFDALMKLGCLAFEIVKSLESKMYLFPIFKQGCLY